ncbi:zinc finger protein 268 [Rhinolophus ferrumequinum]|uniref:zinc finger protein 268 n=1 Tax=Rhinolophus ferrumequinum TaxID=59479 RepID=UPI00140FB82E|nr:zinc finger protein 268 [Rhinolophus ferrumequinum]
MATRVRTAAIWVPPLQEGDSPCGRIRRLHSQESILRQGTPAQSPLPREPQPRHKSLRTEQVLEWLFSSQEQPKTATSQGPLSFTDVCVHFTWEEWQLLDAVQKHLYRIVTLENYGHLVSLGYQHTKPDIILKLEQEGEQWMTQSHVPSQGQPVFWNITMMFLTKSGKWRITWNGLREIKASWEVQQNTVNTLHLENYVFLLQILFPQDKSFINMTHMERV